MFKWVGKVIAKLNELYYYEEYNKAVLKYNDLLSKHEDLQERFRELSNKYNRYSNYQNWKNEHYGEHGSKYKEAQTLIEQLRSELEREKFMAETLVKSLRGCGEDLEKEKLRADLATDKLNANFLN